MIKKDDYYSQLSEEDKIEYKKYINDFIEAMKVLPIKEKEKEHIIKEYKEYIMDYYIISILHELEKEQVKIVNDLIDQAMKENNRKKLKELDKEIVRRNSLLKDIREKHKYYSDEYMKMKPSIQKYILMHEEFTKRKNGR